LAIGLLRRPEVSVALRLFWLVADPLMPMKPSHPRAVIDVSALLFNCTLTADRFGGARIASMSVSKHRPQHPDDRRRQVVEYGAAANTANPARQGAFSKRLLQPAKTDVLLLDDWGWVQSTAPPARTLMGIVDDHAAHKATIITSQPPI
jgi:hypothetical protein